MQAAEPMFARLSNILKNQRFEFIFTNHTPEIQSAMIDLLNVSQLSAL